MSQLELTNEQYKQKYLKYKKKYLDLKVELEGGSYQHDFLKYYFKKLIETFIDFSDYRNLIRNNNNFKIKKVNNSNDFIFTSNVEDIKIPLEENNIKIEYNEIEYKFFEYEYFEKESSIYDKEIFTFINDNKQSIFFHKSNNMVKFSDDNQNWTKIGSQEVSTGLKPKFMKSKRYNDLSNKIKFKLTDPPYNLITFGDENKDKINLIEQNLEEIDTEINTIKENLKNAREERKIERNKNGKNGEKYKELNENVQKIKKTLQLQINEMGKINENLNFYKNPFNIITTKFTDKNNTEFQWFDMIPSTEPKYNYYFSDRYPGKKNDVINAKRKEKLRTFNLKEVIGRYSDYKKLNEIKFFHMLYMVLLKHPYNIVDPIGTLEKAIINYSDKNSNYFTRITYIG